MGKQVLCLSEYKRGIFLHANTFVFIFGFFSHLYSCFDAVNGEFNKFAYFRVLYIKCMMQNPVKVFFK